jgi:hypothetical protein
MRRPILSAAAPACLLLGLTPMTAMAAEAPAGEATATALKAGSLVGVSETGAKADPGQADSRASVIRVGEQALLETGGTQASDGEKQGALVDTGPSAPVRVQVAPWKADANGSKASGTRTARANAALARVDAPGVKLGVLTSDSQAEHTTQKSEALSTSDAVDLTVGNTARVVLLHSEVGSTGKGHSYLVAANGTKIGTDEDTTKVCNLDTGVASLSCLTASGGVADGLTTGSAEVLGVEIALGLDPTAAFRTSASFGTGTVTPPLLPAIAEQVLPATEAPRTVSAAPTGELPRTGVALASVGAAGLAAGLTGAALRRTGGRRRRAA